LRGFFSISDNLPTSPFSPPTWYSDCSFNRKTYSGELQ
jgi:hypothetical protein